MTPWRRASRSQDGIERDVTAKELADDRADGDLVAGEARGQLRPAEDDGVPASRLVGYLLIALWVM